jgi:hypothetical protein
VTETADIQRTIPKRIWNAIKIIIALILIGIVISRTEPREMMTLWETLSRSWLLASVGFFILMTMIKALQYRALIDRQLSYWNVLNIIVMQNAISNFLSNTAGLVSYMSMFRAEHGVRISRSALAFIFVKVGDLFAILVMLGSSLVVVWSQVGVLHGLLVFLCVCISIGLGVFITTVFFHHWFLNIIKKILSGTGLNRYSIIQRGFAFLESISGQEHSLVFAMLWKSILFSSIYFTCTLAWFYTVIRTFHIPIDFSAMVFISAMLQIISFIPIQVFGGLGVSEISSMFLYGLFGIAQPEISAALLGIRIYNSLLNGLSLLYIPFGKSRQ